MEAIFLNLCNLSLTASLLILAVIAVRLLFRKAPRWFFCVLWGLVALRLLLPVSVESPVSLIPSAEPLPKDIIYTATPEIQSGVPVIDSVVNPVLTEVLTPAPNAIASANPTQIWSAILAQVWAMGIVLMVLYACISWFLLCRKVLDATKLERNIRQTDRIAFPFVLGFFRPVIYLPYSMSPEDRTYVIAHEKAHIARKDHWWKPIGFFLLAVYWMNPLIWVAYILLCRDIEAACDEKVIGKKDRDWLRAYSTALLNCSVHRRSVAACPLAFGEVGVKDRIKKVMHYKKPAFWVVILAVILGVVMAVCFLTNPQTPQSVEVSAEMVPMQPYGVTEVTFEDGSFGFTVEAQKNTPVFRLDAQRKLFISYDQEQDRTWEALGSISPMVLSKENFDDLFREGIGNWANGASAADLRENNAKAWCASQLFYILEQKSGDLYLAVGYDDEAFDNGPLFRWLFKLAPQMDGKIQELIPGTAFVSWQCLYMNPLSSFAAIGGDSGYRYIIEEDSFVMEYRQNTISISPSGEILRAESYPQSSIAVKKWQWQEFPFTPEEWDGLFFPDGIFEIKIHDLYEEILFQPLAEDSFLLRLDGDVWIVDLSTDTNGKTYLWSIYSLIPESVMGSAQWEFAPAMSSRSPVFAFRFDVADAEITAFCGESMLVDFNGTEEPSHSKTINSDECLYWAPFLEDGGYVGEARIHVSIKREETHFYEGTIYISRGEKTQFGYLYTAKIVGTGLHISQHPEEEGALIAITDNTTDTYEALTVLKQALIQRGIGYTEKKPEYEGFMSVDPVVLQIVSSADLIKLYEYPSEEQALNAAKGVHPGGCEITIWNQDGTKTSTNISWISYPHWYRKGNVIALYVGEDPAILDIMEDVFGTQFAGYQ